MNICFAGENSRLSKKCLAPYVPGINFFENIKLFPNRTGYIGCNVTKAAEWAMNDKKAMRLIGQGKTEYMNGIADAYYDDIYRFCRFQTGDADWAYDLTQETFLRFIRYADSMKAGNVKGYLLTIAMNVCRDGWGERKRRDAQAVWEETADARPAPCGQQDAEDRFMVQEALLMLPDYQREAIVLHFYHGLKYREIGKMTGSSVSTVKSRIRQGCRKMKERLEGGK